MSEKVERVGRRAFLEKAGSAAVGGGILAACGAGESGGEAGAPAVQTRPRVQWRMASSFPRGLDAIFGAAERLAAEVERMSEGRFTIRVYPAGELVPALEVMDAVQNGSVQCGHSPSYYFQGKNPVLSFDTCVPFGFTPRQQLAWLLEGGGMELMRPLFSDFGIINFVAGNTSGQMGGWFRREINTASDLQGLKMRIPGLGGEVMSRLGTNVQVLAAGDIYPALERGAIDATEWVGPYDDEKLGLQDAATYYYYPGWWEPGPSMTLLVNQQAYDQLPSDYQAILENAAYTATAAMLNAFDARNPDALQRLIQGGTQLRRFSNEILAAAKDQTTQMLEEAAAGDASYRQVYEQWKGFRDKSFSWFSTNEKAYQDFIYSNL
ncbi:MAG: TRAP transporter substrate-binding protein [Gemmatimonadota bacterium]